MITIRKNRQILKQEGAELSSFEASNWLTLSKGGGGGGDGGVVETKKEVKEAFTVLQTPIPVKHGDQGRRDLFCEDTILQEQNRDGLLTRNEQTSEQDLEQCFHEMSQRFASRALTPASSQDRFATQSASSLVRELSSLRHVTE